MRNDPTERPSIRDIINELNNMDSNTTESSLDQVCLSLEDMLRIEPLELHFPNESIAQSIFLTNDTDGYFAFKVRMFLGEPGQWNIQPDEGLVPPRSNCTVTISFDARVIIPVEEKYMKPGIHVLSTKVDGSLLANDVTDYMSAGKLVDTVDVMVVLGGSSTII
ncbi:hypothetical protein QOZ80_9BG0713550 [Eleusine coracana subsp. coracana]|nr:hypothetical protein QOZ80_9BG0713550 [Eleusine coracana subsp. coracana]